MKRASFLAVYCAKPGSRAGADAFATDVYSSSAANTVTGTGYADLAGGRDMQSGLSDVDQFASWHASIPLSRKRIENERLLSGGFNNR